MNYELERHTEEKGKTVEEKWQVRREFRMRERETMIEQTRVDLSRIRVELIQVMDMTKRKCKECPEQLTLRHMKSAHQL